MSYSISRRTMLKGGAAATAFAATGLAAPGILRAADTVKVGLSIPITGLQAILGETLLNCYKMAADELNAKDGIGGRKIELIVEDNQTSTKGSIDKARKLIGEDNVNVLMGNIISVERSATLSVTKRAKKLFFYPTQFEGGECDPYFVAMGAIPPQEVDPVVPWIVENVGKSVYILGSDYAWPRKMTEAITAALEKSGGKLAGADFYPFGTQDFGPAFQRVKDLNPDLVWSMVVGNDGLAQLKQYRSFDIKPPLVGPSDDVMIQETPELAAGSYAAHSYFMAVDTPQNKRFIESYRALYGADRMVNTIGESGYNSLHLYALAAAKAGSVEDAKVLEALPTVEFEAPQGVVRVDKTNNHCVLHSFFAKVDDKGRQFEIVKDFGAIVPATPYCTL